MVPNQSPTTPLEEISDPDHPPLNACVEVTRWLLTSTSSLPTGAARPRAVLKNVILCPNMAARPRRTERAKPLRLACWNAEGMRDRKLEMEHFLNQHGVDICILSDTFLNHGQAFRLANYICHRKDTPTAGGGIAILVLCGIVHPVPIPDLNHLQATAIQVTMASKPVKILLAYLSPSRPLSGEDLSTRFGGEMPVLMADDLNAKHVDWNSRLSTRRGNSCVIRRTGTTD